MSSHKGRFILFLVVVAAVVRHDDLSKNVVRGIRERETQSAELK
jgi:hypothetical protein